MKKKLVRIVAAVLVALLALTLIPMGALAIEVDVFSEAYGKHPTYDEWLLFKGIENAWDNGSKYDLSSVTIKTSDYDSHIVTPDGNKYDLKGIIDIDKLKNGEDNVPTTSSMSFKTEEWGNNAAAYLLYLPHQHKLTPWYSDGNTHWRNCLVCKEKLLYQDWCQDEDTDEICDVCGGAVPYYDVTVIEDEGGKITVNTQRASHRTKITADVEVNEGYRLKKLHFTKIRPDGSRQEVVRYEDNGQFWTNMPTYDLEVSAEFIQK